MNFGFTTGSCAAAAARAAAIMLFENCTPDRVSIMTPAKVAFFTPVEDASCGTLNDGARFASCAVRKHSGDDPDVTDGMLIYCRAQLVADGKEEVVICGGEGIGKVTRPGLDRKVGEDAINTVPRRMIDLEVRSVMQEHECKDSVIITVYAPQGEEIAKKTFNERLGITGGISIIGTSGLVEPMSTKALIDTIKVELKQKKALGNDEVIVSLGNYGIGFMKTHYGYDLDEAVKCSNFIGETVDAAKSIGFSKMLLCGHIGKLIKVSGGIMNTHSHEADCRMELMAAAAARRGADRAVINKILDCVSTEEAYAFMLDAHIEKECMAYIMERISFYLRGRAGDMGVECIVYSNKYGLLGKTEGAEAVIRSKISAAKN